MRQVITFVIILAVASCGWFKATKDPTEGWSAERLYEYAKGKLDQGNYADAIEYYEKLEARYPFGIYGQQALLDVAYAYYKNEEPDSAIAACERFIKLYPQHPHVDYAYYLKGLSNFNRGKKLIHVYLPLDLSQRDPGSALQAFRDFQVLVKNYPDSIYDEDAKLRMLYLRNMLARYEVNVAQIEQALLDVAYAYYKNEEPDSAIAACERFIKLYPQHPHVDYAYYLKGLSNFNRGKKLIHVYLPLDLSQRDPGSALQAFRDFQVLVKNYPDSIYDEDAKLRMLYLRNMLARYEVNVAHYYMRRSAYLAAANRSRYVIENYPRATAVPDALAVMCKAYKVMGLDELSDDALRVLKTNYPEHPEIAELDSIVIQ